ncbi:MAG: hypothetical protein IKZ87_01700 [Actinomycetaceae bacterium]|nr:hypothetical protein [Actinomycetaceae bacterium]
MGFFSPNLPQTFVGGARGFLVAYDNIRVSYLSPNEYKEGAHLLGFEGQEPPFKTRTDEIIAWGAVCIAAGEAMLRTFDVLSFAPGLDGALRAFRQDAIGIVCWRLRLEHRDLPHSDVSAAVEKELEHIQVLVAPDVAPKKAFVFKNFEEG